MIRHYPPIVTVLNCSHAFPDKIMVQLALTQKPSWQHLCSLLFTNIVKSWIYNCLLQPWQHDRTIKCNRCSVIGQTHPQLQGTMPIHQCFSATTALRWSACDQVACFVVKPPFLIVSLFILQSGWPFRWQRRQCQEFCLRKPEVYIHVKCACLVIPGLGYVNPWHQPTMNERARQCSMAFSYLGGTACGLCANSLSGFLTKQTSLHA